VVNSLFGKIAAVTGSSSGIGQGSQLGNKPKPEALLENISLRRLGQPADVAGAVTFLASADADYITGTTLFVDGGLLWNY